MKLAPDTELYDRDFYEWIQQNVDLLRRGCAKQSDLAHIAEEIEDVSKRDQRAVTSRLEVLVMHLLKWKYQPEKRYSHSGKSSWLETIAEQRQRLAKLFEKSPSLKRVAASELSDAYLYAVQAASRQTLIPLSQLPTECPFTLDEVVDEGFLPD
jgi:hypothetical protein